MEKQMEYYDFGLEDTNVKKMIDNVIKSIEYDQNSSSRAGDFGIILNTHDGEKSNKCNQCGFASSQAGNLMKHLKTHSGEKSNKCNQCGFTSSQTGDLRRLFENAQWGKIKQMQPM